MLLGKSGRLGSPEQLFGYQFCAAVGASRCLHVVKVVGVNVVILKRQSQARLQVVYFITQPVRDLLTVWYYFSVSFPLPQFTNCRACSCRCIFFMHHNICQYIIQLRYKCFSIIQCFRCPSNVVSGTKRKMVLFSEETPNKKHRKQLSLDSYFGSSSSMDASEESASTNSQ